jgi:hypothetical protein
LGHEVPSRARLKKTYWGQPDIVAEREDGFQRPANESIQSQPVVRLAARIHGRADQDGAADTIIFKKSFDKKLQK